MTYIETVTTTVAEDGARSSVVEKDWNADGSVNQAISNTVDGIGNRTVRHQGPVFQGGADRFEEYSHYRWDGQELTGYWEDYSNTSSEVDGKQVTTGVGYRYVLDFDTATALLNDGNKIEAIKHYRFVHNVGLKEAKEAINEMQKRW